MIASVWLVKKCFVQMEESCERKHLKLLVTLVASINSLKHQGLADFQITTDIASLSLILCLDCFRKSSPKMSSLI